MTRRGRGGAVCAAILKRVTPEGVTVKALAPQIGASKTQTYDMLELLREEGQLERDLIRGKRGRPAWRYWKAYW